MGIRRTLCIISLLAAATFAAAAQPSPPAGALFWPSRIDRAFPFEGIPADLNHDGLLDVVTFDPTCSCLLVSFGDPDSLFTSPRVAARSSDLSHHFSLLDLTGDGNTDVVVDRSDLFVFPGKGDGTFTIPRRVTTPDRTSAAGFRDMNGDGRLDIVATTQWGVSAESVVLLNTGDLEFVETDRYTANEPATFVALADVDGNGVTDILTWRGMRDMRITRRGPAGEALGHTFLDIGEHARAVVPADLDGDGNVDLVVIVDWVAKLYRGLGDGRFELATTVQSQASYYSGFSGALIEDVDEDGDNDLILSCGENMKNDIIVAVNDGGWQFGRPRQYDTANYYSPSAVAMGDVNGDERRDLLILASGFAHVYEGSGSGADIVLQAPQIDTDRRPLDVAVADIDGDGQVELITTELGAGTPTQIRVYGQADRHFRLLAETPTVEKGVSLALIDLNGDPHVDALATWSTGGSPEPVVGHALSLLGRPDGTFEEVDHRQFDGYIGQSIVGDVNGDGVDDYVRRMWRSVTVFVGDGSGSFTTTEELVFGEDVVDIALSDLDGDGRDDLTLGYHRAIGVRYAGSSGFSDEKRYVVPGYGLATADFNADGRTDIFAAGSDIYVLVGRASGGFATLPPVTPSYGFRPSGSHTVVPCDVSGDGTLDLMIKAGGDAPNAYVLVGRGDGTFDEHPYFYEAGFGNGRMVVADFDQDGSLDAVSTSDYGEPIKILWGLRQNGSSLNTAVSPHITLRIAPNPFRTSATFYYAAATPGVVRATIFDVAGRRVASLVDDSADAGPRTVIWNGRMTTGATTPAGVYFVEIRQGFASGRRRVIRLP